MEWAVKRERKGPRCEEPKVGVGEEESAIEGGEAGKDDLLGGRAEHVGPSGLRAAVGDLGETGDVWCAVRTDEVG